MLRATLVVCGLESGSLRANVSGVAGAFGALGLVFGVLARIAVTRLTAGTRVTAETRPGIRSCFADRCLGSELSTMAAFIAVGVWSGILPGAPDAMVIGYLTLAWASIVLTHVDLRTNRLPNEIVYPTVLVLASCVLLTAIDSQDWRRALIACATACVLAACYATLWLLGGLGFGDVKLSFALGLALGWSGWFAALIGTLAAFVLSGAFALITVTKRTARAGARIPFGPWMLLGAWVGLFATSPITV